MLTTLNTTTVKSSSSLEKFLSRQGYHQLLLEKYDTGHFVFTVSVNHVQGRFILDTGASHTIVDETKKDRFLLLTEDCEKKGSGVGGEVFQTQVSNGNTVSFSSALCLAGQTVYVMPLHHVNAAFQKFGLQQVDGVLGADVLLQGDAILDYKEQTLFLKF